MINPRNVSPARDIEPKTWQSPFIRTLGAIALSMAILLVGPACGASSNGGEKTPRVQKAINHHVSPWGISSIVGQRRIRIVSSVDYCAGDPKPHIRHVSILYHDWAAYVTVEAVIPRRKSPGMTFCAGIELPLYRTIRLTRDLKDVKIYDGGIDPPQQRWPEQLKTGRKPVCLRLCSERKIQRNSSIAYFSSIGLNVPLV
jgi:hypothetical protein